MTSCSRSCGRPPSACSACDPAAVTAEAHFADDLDADSLALVEIIMAVEDRLDIQVPEEELKDVRTVGAALDLLAAKVGAAA